MGDAAMSPPGRLDLTVVILSFNEALHIERCVRHARGFAARVMVVDSYSSDATVQMATALGASVWQHAFVNHAQQLSWALAHLPIDTEWVMRLDADEVLDPQLQASLAAGLWDRNQAANGFYLMRAVQFQGSLIRHGGFPHPVLRVWRRGQTAVEQRWMDEHMLLLSGTGVRLKGLLIDSNLNNLSWWIDKHNGYATREAIDLLNMRHAFLATSGATVAVSSYRAWVKGHVYRYLPLGLRAALFFVYRMVFRLGILDGFGGLPFHVLQGFWYRFLVDMKVREVDSRMRADGVDCPEAIKRQLNVSLS